MWENVEWDAVIPGVKHVELRVNYHKEQPDASCQQDTYKSYISQYESRVEIVVFSVNLDLDLTVKQKSPWDRTIDTITGLIKQSNTGLDWSISTPFFTIVS